VFGALRTRSVRRAWLEPEEELVCAVRDTSWGWMGAVASPRGLRRLTLPRDVANHALREIADEFGPVPADAGAFAHLFSLLERYFAGERVVFDVPLDPWGTEFQVRVWTALRRIPYGETRSYQDVGRMVDRPKGAHAVGQAVGRNPFGIVVPCHRVIAADGTLGGFGGMEHLKSRLLALEGVNVRPSR
jgi:methylated-DNA-[protein]-cysteine S-methyltransferase